MYLVVHKLNGFTRVSGHGLDNPKGRREWEKHLPASSPRYCTQNGRHTLCDCVSCDNFGPADASLLGGLGGYDMSGTLPSAAASFTDLS
jgi:hypothetical protein